MVMHHPNPPHRMANAQSTVDPQLEPATGDTPARSVYFFGGGRADGTKDMKVTLGGKGANLAEMTNLGVPVPPGFTIACDVCIAFLRDGRAPGALREEV